MFVLCIQNLRSQKDLGWENLTFNFYTIFFLPLGATQKYGEKGNLDFDSVPCL